MIYGYIRVSTEKQTDASQRNAIKDFCEKSNLVVNRWVSETISGTKTAKERKLGDILANLNEGDIIIATELSRIGRSMMMVMGILDVIMRKGAKLWTIKDNYRLGDDMQSKVMAMFFSMAAEMERNLISQRTKEGLRLKKLQGVKLGRPFGPGKRKLDEHLEQIKQLLEIGINKRQIARIFEVNASTVHEFLNARGLREIRA